MLVASGVKRLIDEGKTTSLRGMFYMLKHTIEGTKENTFDTQQESDPIIEDMEVTLDALREALHLYADNAGSMVGPLTLIDSGDEINCARMGSGGYSIPSIVEPDVIEFVKCDAKFVLHVEKGTVWRRFNEDKFWQKHKCILTHGGGQPPRGVRRLLYRLHHELSLPIYCLLDNDPWGYYIYSVLKQGSINLAFESKRMAIPEAKFLGLRSIDFERCDLSPSVQIALNDNDRKRARQIAEYPWFQHKKAWQEEIDQMLKNDFKLEVEALISKDISYVTEAYVPARLADRDFLD
jgi:DNA topoisomerase-6 subunit A